MKQKEKKKKKGNKFDKVLESKVSVLIISDWCHWFIFLIYYDGMCVCTVHSSQSCRQAGSQSVSQAAVS